MATSSPIIISPQKLLRLLDLPGKLAPQDGDKLILIDLTSGPNPQLVITTIAAIAGNTFILTSTKGAANGVASLNADGDVPDAQIADNIMRKAPTNGTYRVKTDGTGSYFQLKNATTGKWHTVFLQGNDNAANLAWAAVGEA